MEVEHYGAATTFGALPTASVFRAHANGTFARFIKAHDAANQHHIVVISLGPFLGTDKAPHLYDPGLFFTDDTPCLDETANVVLVPIPEEPREDGAFLGNGNILVGAGDVSLFLKMGPSSNDRRCVSLRTGTVTSNAPATRIVYEGYKIIRPRADTETLS